ncbi:hypothetical protein EZ242_06520 [Ramlibacter rhizophilus]|uniref:Uncharacterized protein n=2 Tax=Ramlibacter rhizophilus TaxID=1781167 RepID=A0A4Z0BSN1_9BURK|nr:hypothetical protein EZ242_06520 [Ramlibacter rhizophilus]
MDDVQAGRLAASLLGLQCVLEGLACAALAPPPGELARMADAWVPLRPLVLHQEMAHRKLGTTWVARLAPADGAELRSARADYVALGGELLEAGLSSLDCLAADADHYRAAVRRELAGACPGIPDGHPTPRRL